MDDYIDLPGTWQCLEHSPRHCFDMKVMRKHLYAGADVNEATSRKELESMFKGQKNRPVYLKDTIFDHQRQVIHHCFKVKSKTFQRVEENEDQSSLREDLPADLENEDGIACLEPAIIKNKKQKL